MKLYKINEFSKMTGIPKSTLRYYDTEKLLTPSFRNQENSYRYYNEKDFQLANQISLLRTVDFSIAEIKDVFIGMENEEDLSYYLTEKRQHIQEEISEKKKIAKKIERLISTTQSNGQQQEYCIEEAQRPAMRSITRTCTCDFNDMGSEVRYLYEAAKNQVAGELFMCQEEKVDENLQYKIGLPVKKRIDSFEVENEYFPELKGIRTIHYGSYETIRNGYKQLIDYPSEQSLEESFSFITTFIKGSGRIFRGNQEKYITEIFLPYQEN